MPNDSAALMHLGTVKWFSVEKGFGFIRPDADLGSDAFVHIRVLEASPLASLETGQRVAFAVIKDAKGRLRATQVAQPMTPERSALAAINGAATNAVPVGGVPVGIAPSSQPSPSRDKQ